MLPQQARILELQPLCRSRLHHKSARSAVVNARALSANPATRHSSIVAATTAGTCSVVRSTTAETTDRACQSYPKCVGIQLPKDTAQDKKTTSSTPYRTSSFSWKLCSSCG
jgi:hypothetical protein